MSVKPDKSPTLALKLILVNKVIMCFIPTLQVDSRVFDKSSVWTIQFGAFQQTIPDIKLWCLWQNNIAKFAPHDSPDKYTCLTLG